MENNNYEALEKIFMAAVEANNSGNRTEAKRLFKDVLSQEPRIAEPRLELASIAIQEGDLEEAEAQAREGLQQLERGWKWLDELNDEQMLAHACNLLGEVLKQQSSSEAVMAQGEAAMRALWNEAGELFERAIELDPENPDVIANYNGFRKNRRNTVLRVK